MGTAIGFAGFMGVFLALTALIMPPLFPLMFVAAVVAGVVIIRQESETEE